MKQFAPGPGPERSPPGQQFVEDDTEGEDVGAAVHAVPFAAGLRAQLARAQEELRAVQQASAARDTSRAEGALKRLHQAWSPFQAAASRPAE